MNLRGKYKDIFKTQETKLERMREIREKKSLKCDRKTNSNKNEDVALICISIRDQTNEVQMTTLFIRSLTQKLDSDTN